MYFRKNSRNSLPSIGLGSIRLRGACYGFLAGCFLVFGAGKALENADYKKQARTVGVQAESLARELGRQAVAWMEPANSEKLQEALASIPTGSSALVVDFQGKVLARHGTFAEVEKLRRLSVTQSGHILGSAQRHRLVEARYRMEGRLAPLGEIWVREPLQKPAWFGALVKTAVLSGLLLGFLAWGWLSFSMRGTRALQRSLARAGKEEFFLRAPLLGCGEMKALAQSINQAMSSLSDSATRVEHVYVETALALSRTVEAKDRYTSGHSQRVARHAVELGEALGLGTERLETLRLGGLLHDIGKVAVPDAVLTKPGALTDEEYEAMKRHPMAGDRILSAIPGLRDIADIARSHHEKWDGTGYPMGVAGDSIPLEGRIVCIADAYDALTTKRSYKSAMEVELALQILEKDAGTHFDPQLVALFVAGKRSGRGYKGVSSQADVDQRAA